jgi:NAD(P)-dependent dehydrogenase (short-subunit alcohol dehydrogenase family)
MGACEGKVALVTGASRGIGRAIATRLAAEGADVAVTSRSLDTELWGSSLAMTVSDIKGIGRRAFAVEADLADGSRDRGFIVEEVEAALGPVDILVNNAAGGGFRPFMEWTDAKMRAVHEINNWAAWELARRALPGMRERGSGWILNVSSAAALLPTGPPFSGWVGEQGTIYGGTKAMLNRWTMSLAIELLPSGVKVNTLAPQAAAATEGVRRSIERGQIRPADTEPLDTMAEAGLALVSEDLTHRIAYSLSLLAELRRPVREIRGASLVEGWQPADIDARFAAGQFHEH